MRSPHSLPQAEKPQLTQTFLIEDIHQPSHGLIIES